MAVRRSTRRRPAQPLKKRSLKPRIRKKTWRKPPTTYIECRMHALLKNLGIKVEAQFPVARLGKKAGRWFFIDFAIPEKKIAIECDGKAWHTGRYARYHKLRQAELEDMGWTFLRFTGSEIVTDLGSCARTILTHLGGSKT